MQCPKCGTTNEGQANFCIACGYSLTAGPIPLNPQTPPYNGGPPEAVKTSGMAIAALVLGILSLSCGGIFLAIPGLILGIVALRAINQKPHLLKGNGLAIGGIVTSVAGLILTTLLLASILIPSLSRARELAKSVQCASNLRSVGRAIVMYQSDFDGQMPPDLETLCQTEGVDPKQFICPSSKDLVGGNSYIYRGADLPPDAPGDMIVAYDKYENHKGEIRNVLFADCSVRRYEEQDFLKQIEFDNQQRRNLGLQEKPPD